MFPGRGVKWRIRGGELGLKQGGVGSTAGTQPGLTSGKPGQFIPT